MKQAAASSGTNPNDTADSIIEKELAKLRKTRDQLNEENKKYIESHPELHKLIDKFVTSCVASKPTDIVKFGSFFFDDLRKQGGDINANIGPAPIVLCSLPGADKETLVKRLREHYPKVFACPIPHTTRNPRQGEENGVHYHFVSLVDMQEGIDKGKFADVTKAHTAYYGVSFDALKEVRSKNRVAILEVSINAVKELKESHLECKFLFISPQSVEEMVKKIRNKGTETEEKLIARTKIAKEEFEYANTEGVMDAIVKHKDNSTTFERAVKVLQGWFADLDIYIVEQS